MMQSHNELEALAPGYVLRALDPEERQAFEEHLTTCTQCTQRVAEIMAIAQLLSLGVEEKSPSPQLKERILTVAQAERAASPRAEELRQPFFLGKLRQLWTNKAIAAFSMTLLILAVAVLAVWNVRIQNTNNRLESTMETDPKSLARSFQAITILAQADKWWNFTGAEDGPNVTGALARSKQLSASCLVLWGLPQAEGNFYQGWTVKEGVASSAGNLWTLDSGKWLIIPDTMEDMDAVQITLESRKGLAQPEGPVIAGVILKSQP